MIGKKRRAFLCLMIYKEDRELYMLKSEDRERDREKGEGRPEKGQRERRETINARLIPHSHPISRTPATAVSPSIAPNCPNTTGISSHSPAPSRQTPRCESACAPCGTGSASSAQPYLSGTRFTRTVGTSIATDLHIELPDVCEEGLDSIVIARFMKQNELHI